VSRSIIQTTKLVLPVRERERDTDTDTTRGLRAAPWLFGWAQKKIKHWINPENVKLQTHTPIDTHRRTHGKLIHTQGRTSTANNNKTTTTSRRTTRYRYPIHPNKHRVRDQRQRRPPTPRQQQQRGNNHRHQRRTLLRQYNNSIHKNNKVQAIRNNNNNNIMNRAPLP